MSTSDQIRFNINPSKRIFLFLCVTVICFILASVVIGIIQFKGDFTPAKLRISTIIQDLIVFIVPALVVAVMSTRQPADFLAVSRKPGLLTSILTVILIFAMVPLMNGIVAWNESLRLPPSMSALQEQLQTLENNANEFTKLLMSGSSVGAIVISVLIVGVLTGFSEELFFRGTMQRLIVSVPTNRHIAVWTTAFIFSAVHLQIFGFVPRLLLGALFGYLLCWSGSVWLPIIAHVANNTMVVLATKLHPVHSAINLNTIGTGDSSTDLWALCISIAATVACLVAIHAVARREKHNALNQTASC